MMYKHKHGYLPPVLSDLYVKYGEIHSHNTRKKDHFHIARSKCISSTSSQVWNILTSNVDVNISFSKLKITLKLFLQDSRIDLKYPN